MCRAAPPGGTTCASGGQRGATGPLPAPRPQQPLILGMPPPLLFFFFSTARAKECSKTFSNRYFLSDLIYRSAQAFPYLPLLFSKLASLPELFHFYDFLFPLHMAERGSRSSSPAADGLLSFLLLSLHTIRRSGVGISALISPDCFGDKNQ